MAKADAVTIDMSNFQQQLAANMDKALTDPDYLNSLNHPPCKGNPITIGPRVIPPDQWAAKQVANAVAAGATYAANIMTPKKDPISSAIAANGKRINNLQTSITQKKWEKAMANIDEDTMYAVIKASGSAAYTNGVTNKAAKVTNVVAQLQPMVSALCATIDKMPQDTDAQRAAKMLAARQGMIDIGKKRRGIT